MVSPAVWRILYLLWNPTRLTKLTDRLTMVWNKQESRRKYWATRSTVRLFARTAHSLSLLRPACFTRVLRCAHLFARLLTSLTPSLVGKWIFDVSKWPGFVPKCVLSTISCLAGRPIDQDFDTQIWIEWSVLILTISICFPDFRTKLPMDLDPDYGKSADIMYACVRACTCACVRMCKQCVLW